MIFAVRLFPEITIKSPPVRKRLTKLLTESLRQQGRRLHPKAKVRQEWDRLEVVVPEESPEMHVQCVDMLKHTPGIANFSHVTEHSFASVDDIYQHALSYWQDKLEQQTFAVRVRRVGLHDFTSMDVERYVGGGLKANTGALGVRLKNPDVTVHIEIRDTSCYIVEQRYEGLGGFPVASQEPVLSLISGGFDSIVASYLMIKRGLRTHYCFFNLGGAAHEVAVKEVAFYLWSRFGSTHKVKFITVPFETVVNEILTKIDPSNMGVVLKRMMLRAAQEVAARGKVEALVTGEAIAQVSSQTIPNLAVIDRATDMLVLRPLITTDKRDIIATAREIGTEDFSASIPEYCGVISIKPSAKVNEKKLLEQEALFDMAVLQDALQNTRVQPIDEVMNRGRKQTPPSLDEVTEINADSVVIDIRHPDELELKPLALPCKVHQIPFYQLSSEFEKLDPGIRYLLYCERGVMSKLHAAYLADAGFHNVGLYRPIR